jgi:hypothetical protein
MGFETLLNLFAMMGTQVIQNQNYLAVGILDQSPHKFNQELAGHALGEKEY